MRRIHSLIALFAFCSVSFVSCGESTTNYEVTGRSVRELKEWNRYVTALNAHEAQHAAIAIGSASLQDGP